jgi:hypothetical protein
MLPMNGGNAVSLLWLRAVEGVNLICLAGAAFFFGDHDLDRFPLYILV